MMPSEVMCCDKSLSSSMISALVVWLCERVTGSTMDESTGVSQDMVDSNTSCGFQGAGATPWSV